MSIYGNIQAFDTAHVTFFTNLSGPAGAIQAMDTPHATFFSGYVISDTTTLSTDQTFLQGHILGRNDLTLILADWTYAGGWQLDATTYTGGTWGYRYYNPLWINYSIWYKSYDTSEFTMVGTRDRSPIGYPTVGNFYAPMVVPSPPGHYEIRWRYQKDSNSYAREIDVPFVSLSRGVDSMPDFVLPPPPPGDQTFINLAIIDPAVDIIGLF
jgi:hypothetical protein